MSATEDLERELDRARRAHKRASSDWQRAERALTACADELDAVASLVPPEALAACDRAELVRMRAHAERLERDAADHLRTQRDTLLAGIEAVIWSADDGRQLDADRIVKHLRAVYARAGQDKPRPIRAKQIQLEVAAP